MAMLAMLGLLILAVLINLLHIVLGLSRQGSWGITLAVFAAILAVAGYAIKNRWDGVFIDKDNRISLSRFQLILWTMILVSALFTAGLTNFLLANPPPPAPPLPGPLAINIPPQIWALLGLGAFTAVAAPAITDGKRGAAGVAAAGGGGGAASHRDKTAAAVKEAQNLTAPAVFDGRVMTKAETTDARWVDLIMGDYEGSAYVDASKLQKLAFTVLLATLYSAQLWRLMAGSTFIGDFPPVNDGFLALLAISHAAYLADKQIAST